MPGSSWLRTDSSKSNCKKTEYISGCNVGGSWVAYVAAELDDVVPAGHAHAEVLVS